ncbi:MAG TPA: sugar phosphate isomerase/epimerase [Bacteroides sp.]|nr:sugar phosphate isomerase/epimerase [Bacteroides sp.]
MNFSRRNFLRLSGIGLMASQVPGSLARDSQPGPKTPGKQIPFALGIASYTFREFDLGETLEMTRRLGIGNIALKSMHMPLESTPEEIAQIAGRIRNAGIDLYGAGVIYMTSGEEVDRAFEYAKQAGLKVIIGVPDHDLLDLCNKKVQQYDIRLAIHNHGPGDEKYPSPESAFTRISHLDPRMGLCMDIGHMVRIGLDPVVETSRFFDRVHDVHIKDVDKAESSGTTVEIGRGIIDIEAFLKLLLKKNYRGVASFEYEKDGHDPLPGLAESVGYVRGMLNCMIRKQKK